MKQRNKFSNIQLLRILLILMVILLHYNYEEIGGGFAAAKGYKTYYMLTLFESMAICAVNTFVIISGFLSIEKRSQKIGKVLTLFVWVIVYQVLISVFSNWGNWQIKHIVKSVIPVNYYVYIYSTLYLLAPFINKLIESMDKKTYKKLLVVLLLLFSVEPTIVDCMNDVLHMNIFGVSTISLMGSESGYSIVNFIMLYLLGGYIKKYDIHCKKRLCLAMYTALVIGIWILSRFTRTAWEYCNILVIFQTIALFMFFKECKIPQSKVINLFAESVFGVFLVHAPLIKLLTRITNMTVHVESLKALSVNIMFCVVLCFLFCMIIDKILKIVFASLGKIWENTRVYNYKI